MNRDEFNQEVREALDKLDGTTESTARLLTGMTPEEFAEIRGNEANARLAAETERAIRNHPNNKDRGTL